MSTWIIQDWMGRHVFTDRVFRSFEEARDFISEYAEKESNGNEDDYDGICEDLYAEELSRENAADDA